MTEYSKTLLYKQISRLADVAVPDLEKLFDIAEEVSLAKAEYALKKGRICNRVLFVEEGYLRTFAERDAREVNTDFTFEGQFTTNLKSLRSGEPADSFIQAGENCRLFSFDKNRLLGLYKVSADIESFGRKLLEQLLMIQEEHTKLFKMYSPADRYRYLQEHKPEMLERISLTQLASYLGVARETLSRIRKR